MAVLRAAVLVGAPYTTRGDEEGAAYYLYSARSGALLASFEGRAERGELGSNVALLRASAALAGRGPTRPTTASSSSPRGELRSGARHAVRERAAAVARIRFGPDTASGSRNALAAG